MARYWKGFKSCALARLLPPETSSMEQIAADVCARAITLRTRVSSESASEQAGIAKARLEAMIVVASVDDSARYACFPDVRGVLPRNG